MKKLVAINQDEQGLMASWMRDLSVRVLISPGTEKMCISRTRFGSIKALKRLLGTARAITISGTGNASKILDLVLENARKVEKISLSQCDLDGMVVHDSWPPTLLKLTMLNTHHTPPEFYFLLVHNGVRTVFLGYESLSFNSKFNRASNRVSSLTLSNIDDSVDPIVKKVLEPSSLIKHLTIANCFLSNIELKDDKMAKSLKSLNFVNTEIPTGIFNAIINGRCPLEKLHIEKLFLTYPKTSETPRLKVKKIVLKHVINCRTLIFAALCHSSQVADIQRNDCSFEDQLFVTELPPSFNTNIRIEKSDRSGFLIRLDKKSCRT